MEIKQIWIPSESYQDSVSNCGKQVAHGNADEAGEEQLPPSRSLHQEELGRKQKTKTSAETLKFTLSGIPTNLKMESIFYSSGSQTSSTVLSKSFSSGP